jgi:hypothetical protein
MMATMDSLPAEILETIGYCLKSWEDIHSFSTVRQILRRNHRFAVYAREAFERDRLGSTPPHQRCLIREERRLLHIGDDRVVYYVNPRFDDRVIELWRSPYTWIDYAARFYEGEITPLTWCYLPYGENFNGQSYVGTIDVHIRRRTVGVSSQVHFTIRDVIACIRNDNVQDRRPKMKTWLQRKIKNRYDNLFKRMLIREVNTGGQFSRQKRNFRCGCYPISSERKPVGFGVLEKYVLRNLNRSFNPSDYTWGKRIDVRRFLTI